MFKNLSNGPLAAALVQVLTKPASAVPMVGASGAISGVMGGYLILFPRVRMFCLLVLGFFVTSVALPAWLMLVYWLAIVGGFLTGCILVKLFAQAHYLAAHQAHQ